MKSLMRSYVYWLNMDKDIGNIVKTCKGCALAVKAPTMKYSSWPKTDRPRSRIHTEFASPRDGFCYLKAEDSFSKWPELLRCTNPTAEVTINFLQELFARFGLVDWLESDNKTQITSGDFKDFCETQKSYHDRSISPKVQRSGRALCWDAEEKSFWEMGTIEKTVENMIYIIKGPQFTHHNRLLNQIRKRFLGDSDAV